MALDQGADVLVQLAGGGSDAAPQLLADKLCKPAFDLVDPGGRSWFEMDVIARSAGKPFADESRLWAA